MKNALTFDLEEYFQVSAFADRINPDDWDSRPSRVQETTERLLQLLEDHRCQATFFTLGWVAKKYPQLVRQIAQCGHEIACHSLDHRLVYQMDPAGFGEDTQRAKDLLESVSGVPVRGYRAPSFSITAESLWAFETLAGLGFTYDSSIFPVRHPNYGMPQAPRFPFLVKTPQGDLVEFPMPTLAVGNRRSPIGGGAYLRLLPYWYTRWGIRYINNREEQPVCVYLHPWELDASQPRMRGSPTAQLRHYVGLRGTETKLRTLLRDFDFVPLGRLVAECSRLDCVVTVGDEKRS